MENLPIQIMEALRQNSILLKRGFSTHGDDFSSNIGGQGRLLVVLMENSGISQKALSNLLRIRPQTLGELLNKREASGMIERRPNKYDKRITNIYLTDKGYAQAQKILEHSNDEINKIFSTMSTAELESLYTLVNKLNKSIETNIDHNGAEFKMNHEIKGE